MENLTDLAINSIVLDRLKYHVAAELPFDIGGNFDVMFEDLPYRMARQFAARWELPGKILSDDRIVAEYPATLWDHIKSKLGWTHRTRTVHLKEVIAFPDVDLPPRTQAVHVQWIENEGVRI